jgi:hypothetical protein
MLAICVAACAWGVLVNARAELPQAPDAVPYAVIGALGKYAGNDLEQARKIMTGSKTTDMVNRLQTIHQHLLTIPTFYQLEQQSSTVSSDGGAVVVSQVRIDIDTPDQSGDSMVSGAYPWTFHTVHQTFPQPGWFLTDFTAPDECSRYVQCGPTHIPIPTTAAYPVVYLSCAVVNPQGTEDKVVTYAITLDSAGRPDFTTAWQTHNARSTTDPAHDEPAVSSPVERAALRATGSGDKATSIGVLYADCAQRFDLSQVAGSNGRLGGRVAEYRGVMVLCPGHPDTPAIRAAVARG